MQRFISGYRKFRRDVFPQQAEKHKLLAKYQKPHTLFITCADSRVVPSDFTQTELGELFQCRVVGNLVPAHGSAETGVTSSIEYAVAVLDVKHIIICGHSDCGAMRAFTNPENLRGLKSVTTWIEYANSAIAVAKEQYGHLPPEAFLTALAKENVVSQLQHLGTHPCVATRLRSNTLEVHGWYYDIEDGTVEQYDPVSQTFIPLDQIDDARRRVLQ
ncbi:MAG: carbonic anhydrase [Acidobacteriota bacterium]